MPDAAPKGMASRQTPYKLHSCRFRGWEPGGSATYMVKMRRVPASERGKTAPLWSSSAASPHDGNVM